MRFVFIVLMWVVYCKLKFFYGDIAEGSSLQQSVSLSTMCRCILYFSYCMVYKELGYPTDFEVRNMEVLVKCKSFPLFLKSFT